jgi:hypothetical protein
MSLRLRAALWRGLLTPPLARPQVSQSLGDLRSAGWLGQETGHNSGA